MTNTRQVILSFIIIYSVAKDFLLSVYNVCIFATYPQC
eukprot:UN04931